MRILALDAALARCSVALVIDDVTVACRFAISERGQSSLLAPMVAEILEQGPNVSLDAVAVTIGPGSFTGLRTAISLAHGLGTQGCPVIGVTVAEALADAVERTPPGLGGRALWTAIDSRRGRVFLDIGGVVRAFALQSLPSPAYPVAIAGDAAVAVAAVLAGQGFDVRLTDARLPDAVSVAHVAKRRLAGLLPPLEAQPFYVDPPEAKLPAGGLRPHPKP